MSFYKEVPGRKTTLESTLKFDTTPTAGSTNPVTSDGVAEAVGGAVSDVLDDHATATVDEKLTMPASEAANYTVDNYFEQNGEIWKCTAKTDNGDGTWTVEAEKVNGVVPVLNDLNEMKEIIPSEASSCNKLTTLSQTKKIIRNVAHRGYDSTQNRKGHEKLSSYECLAKYGFDYGECDIKWSSDNVPVCCHDNTFDDATTGETVTIANHTYAELKTYDYYGETIASFEDVLVTCKKIGVGLYIDQNGYLTDATKSAIVLGIVKKYNMEDDVVWLLQNQTTIDVIQNWYEKSAIGVLFYTAISATQIALANGAYNGKNYVFLDVDQNRTSLADLAANNALLDPGVKIEVWTVNNSGWYKKFLPYVSGITSDAYSQYIIDNHIDD